MLKLEKSLGMSLRSGEKFITEARMYHKMDRNYKIVGINLPIMICEYQKDGYTKNIKEIFSKNPKGYYEYFREILQMPMKGISFAKRLYIYKHYILFSVLTKKKHAITRIKRFSDKLWIILLWIPGKIKTKNYFRK